MSTIINATTTNGVVIQPDNSGSLVLQTNSGTTALTIDTSQNVAFAKGFTVGATAAPAFRAYANVNQTVTPSTSTKVALQVKSGTYAFDTASCFSTSTYLFTPNVAGYYQLNGAATPSSTAANNGTYVTIYLNSVPIATASCGNASGNVYAGPSVSTLIYMNGTTDTASLYVTSVSGATIIFNVFNGSGIGDGTYFSGALVRSA